MREQSIPVQLPFAEAPAEEWRPVVGYEGWYEVSDAGRVKRVKAVPGHKTGRILKLTFDAFGYPRVGLSVNGTSRYRKTHQLVMRAFVGPRPHGLDINHVDGHKANNRLANLEYTSRSKNIQHAYDHDLNPRGERRKCSRLTEDNVRQIRAIGNRMLLREVAQAFDIHIMTVSDILRGKTWKHLA